MPAPGHTLAASGLTVSEIEAVFFEAPCQAFDDDKGLTIINRDTRLPLPTAAARPTVTAREHNQKLSNSVTACTRGGHDREFLGPAAGGPSCNVCLHRLESQRIYPIFRLRNCRQSTSWIWSWNRKQSARPPLDEHCQQRG